MPRLSLTLDALAGWIRGLPAASVGAPRLEPTVVTVDIDAALLGPVPELHSGIPAVVVGLTSSARPDVHAARDACDVLLERGDAALDAIVATVEANPIAATALAMLLRGAPHRTLDDGLTAESAVYSALQAGPEFARWRESRPAKERSTNGPPVRLERVGSVLEITLDRPEVRNAFSTEMRDELVEAFRLPTLDPTITEVHLRGAGDAFCAGGDLDEFGSFTDPASAHVVRLQQSVGRSIAAVADRVTVHLHGTCMGSGIELPAFAHRVLAHPSTVIALPEVSLGLIPGAGGTVSLPRRIGRWRTARLALTGEHLDAHTALRWGLVDAVESSQT